MNKIRTISKTIKKASKSFKAVLICGMRQVGKTTVLKNACEKDRAYVTLDNPKDLLMAKNEPQFFFETYKTPVFIDEIQYASEIFPYIKMITDDRSEKGLFWMSGSQQFGLMQNVTETLAGRLAIFDMLGFSIYEREGLGDQQEPFLPIQNVQPKLAKKDLQETFRTIWLGSYPEIAVMDDESAWQAFYGSYIRTYLERDVRQLITIGDNLTFLKFLKVVAARTAQELNIADIARNVDIAPNTVKNWLSILEASGVIYLLQPYYNNALKRAIKKPKLYFTDTGLCAYLSEWNTPKTLEAGAMSGAFFETFVVTEILKSYYHNGINPSLYYYRDNASVEVDLLIGADGVLYPVEIKKTSNPDKDMVRNFKALKRLKQNIGYGSLICLTDRARPLDENANAVSVWEI